MGGSCLNGLLVFCSFMIRTKLKRQALAFLVHESKLDPVSICEQKNEF